MVNSFNSQVKFSCPGPEPSLTISRPAFYIKIAPSKNSFPAQVLDLAVFLNFYIFIRLEFFHTSTVIQKIIVILHQFLKVGLVDQRIRETLSNHIWKCLSTRLGTFLFLVIYLDFYSTMVHLFNQNVTIHFVVIICVYYQPSS